jgi:hypothetical protein
MANECSPQDWFVRGRELRRIAGKAGTKTDSLFQFKAHLSQQRYQFATWRWVVAPEACRELPLQKDRCNAANEFRPISAEYFPAYRWPTVPASRVSAPPSVEKLLVEEGCLHA